MLSRTLLGIVLGAIPVVGSSAHANWLVPWTDHAVEQDARQRAKDTGELISKKTADQRSKATTQITRSAGAVFGSLLGGIIATWLGRRVSYFLISLGALGASTYIFPQLDLLHPQFTLFIFLLGFIGITYFGWLPLFLPELFPTRVHSTDSSIAFNTGRVVAGRVFSPLAFSSISSVAIMLGSTCGAG